MAKHKISSKAVPSSEDGQLRHSWGKKRRYNKKLNKRIWKVLYRAGVLAAIKISTEDCFWESYGWGGRYPEIRVGEDPDYFGECGDHSLVTHLYDEANKDMWEWSGEGSCPTPAIRGVRQAIRHVSTKKSKINP